MRLFISDLKTLPYLLICFALYALGIWLIIESGLGLGPWNCFNEGLANHLNLTFGQLSQIIGLFILIIAAFFKMYPGIGTVLNIYFIGFFIDVFNNNFNLESTSLLLNIILVVVGNLAIAVAFVLYIQACLGQGPRDSLNQGVYVSFKNKFANVKYGYIKFSIEGIVLILGVALGGTIGIGTIMSLVLTSFFTQQILSFINLDPKQLVNRNFLSYYKVNNEVLVAEK